MNEYLLSTLEQNDSTHEVGTSIKPLKVYIAGPISGVKGYKENFRRAERFLSEKGCIPVNPAILDDDTDYREALNEGLRKLMECDAIYLLGGAQTSCGAIIEWNYARATGMLIISEDDNEDCYLHMREE